MKSIFQKIGVFLQKSRIETNLGNRGVIKKLIFLIALLSLLVSIAWLSFVRKQYSLADYEAAISIGGVLATLLGLSVVILQSTPSPIRVKVLLRNGSPFNEDVYSGISERLSDHEDILLTRLEIFEETIENQHKKLLKQLSQLINDAQVDVIILRPIYDTQEIRELIIKGSSYGILIICIDTIVDPPEVFGHVAENPYYLKVDNINGGILLADHILPKHKSDEKIHVLTLLGPTESKPGTLRSLWFTWRLLSAPNSITPDSISYLVLKNWDRSATTELIGNEIHNILNKMKNSNTKNLFIFCGADAICISSHKYISDEIQKWRKEIDNLQINLLGFDGLKTRGSNEKYILSEYSYCKATIDVSPKEVGQNAANIILGKLKKSKHKQPNIMTIQCHLKDFRTH